jgi:bifunctional enzyme CysN/CysC
VGEPAQPEFPRLFRHDRERPASPRRDVVVAASGRASKVAACIVTADGDRVEEARAGEAVTVTLADEIDIARGDVLAPRRQPPGGRRSVRGAPHLDEREPMLPGRSYLHEDRHAHTCPPRSRR